MAAKGTWTDRCCARCGKKLMTAPHPDTQANYYWCREGHTWKRTEETEHTREAWYNVPFGDFYAFSPERGRVRPGIEAFLATATDAQRIAMDEFIGVLTKGGDSGSAHVVMETLVACSGAPYVQEILKNVERQAEAQGGAGEDEPPAA